MKAQKTLAQELAAALADIYKAGGVHIGAPVPIFHAAANGDQLKLGMCIAAHAIQVAMSQYPEGLEALGQLDTFVQRGGVR